MALKEGKNREIRKLCENFGWRVNRLIRTGFGPFPLGKLPRGAVEEVSQRVVAEQTGVKFSKPKRHANYRRKA